MLLKFATFGRIISVASWTINYNETACKTKPPCTGFLRRSTVRVVRSTRSGAGKSLYVKRRVEELQACTKSTLPLSVSLPLHTRDVDFRYITKHLIPYVEDTESQHARIFHIDITSEVCICCYLEVYVFIMILQPKIEQHKIFLIRYFINPRQGI